MMIVIRNQQCVSASTNTLFISNNDCNVSVHDYSDRLATISNVPVVMVATLWEDPESGSVHILIVHQALYLGDKLYGSLLNPNQLHANGVQVEDVP